MPRIRRWLRLKNRSSIFDIYSSDFSLMFCNDEIILYGDETVLFYVGTTLEALNGHVNSRLQNILNWCNCNKVSLNIFKSEFMVVANKRIDTRPQLYIDADQMKEIIKTLSWKKNAQIKYLKSKLSHLCGVSLRLSNF